MTRKVLLDTNTISDLFGRRIPHPDHRLAEIGPGELLVSAISYGEVWFGLNRRPSKILVRQAMKDFFAEAEILPWTIKTAEIYAGLRTEMETAGKALGSLDMLIAAHALEAGATLVTSDQAFRFVPGLAVEDWMAA